jgi:hypothetical protein
MNRMLINISFPPENINTTHPQPRRRHSLAPLP